jgi:hypothetical protein
MQPEDGLLCSLLQTIFASLDKHPQILISVTLSLSQTMGCPGVMNAFLNKVHFENNFIQVRYQN